MSQRRKRQQETDSNPEVESWGRESGIDAAHIKTLLKDGFTTMRAIKLLQAEDLHHSVPRGQQRLILQAVQDLQQPGTSSPTITSPSPATNEVTIGGTTTEGNQNQADQSDRPAAGGTTAGGQAGNQASTHQDLYRAGIQSWLSSINSGNPSRDQTCQQGQSPAAAYPGAFQQSWADPQIYLQMAANQQAGAGKKALEIIDFLDCAGGMTEEIITSSVTGDFIMRSGPRKPALETISLPQWSVANLAIMSTLVHGGSLDKGGMLDYLSYTTKVYQLLKVYEQSSVFLYDRQYRRHQASYGFRWGTDISHLQSVHLKPRNMGGNNKPGNKPIQKAEKEKVTGGKLNLPRASHTASGQEICRNYNTANGCSRGEQCIFVHVCSYPGCSEKHAASTSHTKN